MLVWIPPYLLLRYRQMNNASTTLKITLTVDEIRVLLCALDILSSALPSPMRSIAPSTRDGNSNSDTTGGSV
ncbi:hypothetical protein [Tortoise microvirus 61]|nr:hypothetical protein [Tortoise microvirus 61]